MCSVILDQVVFGILHLNLASEAILILPQAQPIITDTCAFEGFYRTYFHAITHLYGYEIVVFGNGTIHWIHHRSSLTDPRLDVNKI